MEKNKDYKTRGIVSLVLGILSILLCSLIIIPIGFGVAGICLAKDNPEEISKAGKICSIIGIILTVLINTVFLVILLVAMSMGK